MLTYTKRPRTVDAAGGMAQEGLAPMQLRILRREPTHTLTEGGA
jgi:hypothetical protein